MRVNGPKSLLHAAGRSVTDHIIDAVLVCPGCSVSQAVTITANLLTGGMAPRWRGQCQDCDHAWDFDDE